MDEDDDVPQLSSDTLTALQEFYTERRLKEEANLASDGNSETATHLFDKTLSESFPEDWQMSQFWYDEHTCDVLSKEVLKLAGNQGKVACISCPSVFRACGSMESNGTVHLLEYDKRFEAFGSSYFFYDYNEPVKLPEVCFNSYDVVIADPPFLSEECLKKLSETVNAISKPGAKLILCTGSIMEKVAEKVLPVKKSSFIPKHKNNLGNEFACFTNYVSEMCS